MDLKEIAEACFKLGAPMAVLSGFMFTWLHNQGRLDVRLGRKAISAGLKQMKKSDKKERIALKKDAKVNQEKRSFTNLLHRNATAQKQTGGKADLFYRRWLWFGGGFYGLAALWTFAIVELLDVFSFISNFPGLAALFENGLVSLLIGVVVNQVTNIVSAFAWMTYWADSSIAIWMLVAYLGYLLGIELAKRRARD